MPCIAKNVKNQDKAALAYIDQFFMISLSVCLFLSYSFCVFLSPSPSPLLSSLLLTHLLACSSSLFQQPLWFTHSLCLRLSLALIYHHSLHYSSPNPLPRCVSIYVSVSMPTLCSILVVYSKGFFWVLIKISYWSLKCRGLFCISDIKAIYWFSFSK